MVLERTLSVPILLLSMNTEVLIRQDVCNRSLVPYVDRK